ncbi:AraC family transcriptional regulator, partial [Vibrio rotiferianus]
VTTVALECGFTSLSAFNHLFKQSFGVTPGRFFMN